MEEKKKESENTVLIAGKSLFLYCKAVETILKKGYKECTIKARGKYITNAINVAEISKRDLGTKIDSIITGTEQFETEDKKQVNVSTIAVKISKK